MEKAFHAIRSPDRQAADGAPARIYPLRRELLAVTHAWEEPGGDGFVIATKGAPEAIVELCRLDAGRAMDIRRDADAMAAAGMRVLGVAQARHAVRDLPDSPAAFQFEFLGLVGLADPIAPQRSRRGARMPSARASASS